MSVPSSSKSRTIALAAHVLLAGAVAGEAGAQVIVMAAAPAADVAVETTASEATMPVAEARWLRGATTRFVLGHADNVLWSAVAREGRGFAQAEVEAFLWHPRRTGWEAKALWSGEVRRYMSALPEAAGEQRWVGRGEIAVLPHARLRLAFVPQVFYMDQVYDLSPDLGRRFVAKMRVKGVSGTLHARLALPRGWEIEPSVQERETDYHDFSEDFSENKTGVRLRWRKRAHFEANVAIYDHLRAYRDRVNYTEGGRALAGTKLRFHQTTAEAGLAWSWQWRGRWSVSPALVRVTNRDRASGFFDYDQRRLRCDLSWEGARWRVEVEGAAGRYDYRIQTVGMGIDPPARLREDFTAGINVEYALSSRWKTVLRQAWERSRTNEINASHRVNTVSSGVSWNY